MAIPSWRQITVRVLAEKIGPVADLVVGDALAALGVAEGDMTAAHYIQFIRLLYEKLPASIDRRSMCQMLQASVLKAYGFGNS